jgi:hypothetical protein
MRKLQWPIKRKDREFVGNVTLAQSLRCQASSENAEDNPSNYLGHPRRALYVHLKDDEHFGTEYPKRYSRTP